jgi:hypothetical protein
MPTFEVPVPDVDGALLERLVQDAVREGLQLEYKETLPAGADDDKREFLADVSSFANAAGGDLLYGVRERRDAQGKATGEPAEVVGLPGLNLNTEKLRLESLARDGMDPPIAGLTFQEIRRGGDPPCLLVRVPRSWTGLHMVTFKNLSRFYGRNSAGKYQFDVSEIRRGFLVAETARERLRRFRLERLANISAGMTPVMLGAGERLIFHGLPVIQSEGVWSRFRAMPGDSLLALLRPIVGSTSRTQFNLDGFLISAGPRERPDGYVQVFRDGGIEAVAVGMLAPTLLTSDAVWNFPPGFKAVRGTLIESQLIEAVTGYCGFWQQAQVLPPLVFGLTLSGIGGLGILPASLAKLRYTTFDREVVICPEVWRNDVAGPVDIALRPLFDLVWNAAGWPESPHYGEDGRWRRGD